MDEINTIKLTEHLNDVGNRSKLMNTILKGDHELMDEISTITNELTGHVNDTEIEVDIRAKLVNEVLNGYHKETDEMDANMFQEHASDREIDKEHRIKLINEFLNKHHKLVDEIEASKLIRHINNPKIGVERLKQYLENRKVMKMCSDSCIHDFEDICKKHSVFAFKVLRFRMSSVDLLLADDPSWKIIHLLRDPRGILFSRLHRPHMISSMWKPDVEQDAKKLCQRIHDDVRHRKYLQEKYPNNFLVMKYEDLAVNPNYEMKRVYDFIDMPVLVNVRRWYAENMHSKYGDIGITERADSNKTANKWKSKISNKLKALMQNECKELLEELDYQVVV